MKVKDTLRSLYSFPGFEALQELNPYTRDPEARVVTLRRHQKKNICSSCKEVQSGYYDSRRHCVRDLSCGGTRMYVEFEYHRILCRKCGSVKQETLPWLAASGRFTQRFEDEIGQQCRDMSIKRVAEVNHLGWAQVQRMDRMYLQQMTGHPLSEGLRRIGIDENSVDKGHAYRITVSGLDTPRSFQAGSQGRDQGEPETFFVEIGSVKGRKTEIIVLKTGKPFRKTVLTAYPAGHMRWLFNPHQT